MGKEMSKYKHKVLIYEGGNFSGNFWEWNWCLWDKNGIWHKGFASGNFGIEDEPLAIEVARKSQEISANEDLLSEYRRVSNGLPQIGINTLLLDYTKKKGCKEIAEYSPNIVAGIMKYITEELDEKHQILIECHICGMKSNYIDDFHLDDFHHQGIASWPESFVCMDCKSEHSCHDCGEDYRGSEKLLILTSAMAENGESHVCRHCYEFRIAQSVSMLKELVKYQNKLSKAIDLRKDIEMRQEILAIHLGEQNEPEPEQIENLLLNDTTPFLPMLG